MAVSPAPAPTANATARSVAAQALRAQPPHQCLDAQLEVGLGEHRLDGAAGQLGGDHHRALQLARQAEQAQAGVPGPAARMSGDVCRDCLGRASTSCPAICRLVRSAATNWTTSSHVTRGYLVRVNQ
jgi:hypothetical protein